MAVKMSELILRELRENNYQIMMLRRAIENANVKLDNNFDDPGRRGVSANELHPIDDFIEKSE